MILIVDDDPTFLVQAEGVLGKRDGVFFARNVQHALELMAAVGASFSIVLVDLDLPGMSGLELIARLWREFPDLPVIAMADVLRQHLLETAQELGARAGLTKPITCDWQIVIDRVRGKAKAETC